MSKMMQCYGAERDRGWVRLGLHIGRTGHVDNFEDAGSTVPAAVLSCIQGVLGATTFPECTSCGGYDYTLAFRIDSPPPDAQPPPRAVGSDADGGANATGSSSPTEGGTPSPNRDDKWL